jgi:hypothetical protein
MKLSARKRLWIIAAVTVGVACIPVKSLNCPAWDVWVIDETAQPVSGMAVRLTFQNYSAESRSHELNATTDAQGHAAFSAQTITVSLGRRALATLSSAMEGAHASLGPHASVFAFGEGLESFAISDQNTLVDWTGKPSHMESRIVVAKERRKSGTAHTLDIHDVPQSTQTSEAGRPHS